MNHSSKFLCMLTCLLLLNNGAKAQALCKSGFVWREAYYGDICVCPP